MLAFESDNSKKLFNAVTTLQKDGAPDPNPRMGGNLFLGATKIVQYRQRGVEHY